MILRVALLIALLLPLRATSADPGPVGQWLMNTPASLWALGMTRLEMYVRGWHGIHPLAHLPRGVYYDWDQNRIIISITTSEPFEEDICRSYLNHARESGGVYDGMLTEPISSSFYARHFERGFSTGSEPDGYLQKLDEIMLIRIAMVGGLCEGRLVSAQVLIER